MHEESGAVFVDWELSYKLGFQRPEAVRVVVARAKYKVPVAEAEPSPLPADATVLEQDGKRFTIITAPLPPLLIRRGLLAPSMLARIIVQKFRFGMPFFRQEEQFEGDGIELDRGTMARSVEEVGACLGAIVLACADDARKHAFCLATDATGVAIRPEPLPDGVRQPCRKGHSFVVLADKKHWYTQTGEGGFINWYGYSGLGSGSLGLDLTSYGYPGCDDFLNSNGTDNDNVMLEDPAGCRSNPNRMYRDQSSRCEVGAWTGGNFKWRSGCDTNGGNSGGPVVRRSNLGDFIGHVQWQDCGQCTASTNYPNYYLGHDDFLFNFQNQLRNDFP